MGAGHRPRQGSSARRETTRLSGQLEGIPVGGDQQIIIRCGFADIGAS